MATGSRVQFQATLRTRAGRFLFAAQPRDTIAAASSDLAHVERLDWRKLSDVAAVERTDGLPVRS